MSQRQLCDRSGVLARTIRDVNPPLTGRIEGDGVHTGAGTNHHRERLSCGEVLVRDLGGTNDQYRRIFLVYSRHQGIAREGRILNHITPQVGERWGDNGRHLVRDQDLHPFLPSGTTLRCGAADPYDCVLVHNA